MRDSLRLFIALELPPEARRELANAQANLLHGLPRRALKPSRPDGFHLTLKFLGDSPRSQVSTLLAGIERAAEGISPFNLQAGGLGCFPTPQRPRVLWLGLSGQLEALRRLQVAVEAQIAPLGFPTEVGVFSPHLTLARTSREASTEDQRRIVERLRQPDLGMVTGWKVQEVSLMESELHPEGARYKRLGFARLV